MLAAGIGFLAAFALIFLRTPVAVALALVGFGGYWALLGLPQAMTMTALTASGHTLSYSLSVIPLFVLMGNLICGAGISSDLYRAAEAFVGRYRGGLAMATIGASGGFAAVSGSSVATAVTIGKIAIPSMRSFGYSNELNTATVASGATLGILVPPSVIMVIYGVQTETNIGMLFAAGIIPGLFGILGYALAVAWVASRNPAAAPSGRPSTMTQKLSALRRTWLVAALFIVVLGGIYGGLFTATEAGGIGATGAFVIALIRGVKLPAFAEILRDSAHTTGMLFALVIGASVFGEFINLTGADKSLLAFITESGFSATGTLLTILLIYLLLGCVLESLAMILLTLPIFFPIVMGLGYDPVWFGIVVVMMVELALITPPLGMNLFVVRAIAPDVPLGTIMRGIVPFVTVDIMRVGLMVLFPIIVTWLPSLLFD
ncbi:TRAP transporter large permease [Paracoccus sp. J55]|uniref:TRAP transporter large permease n=1 Tax=Paracoccus sp. J55 TaxID=935849 RepID=UPI00048FC526|nr:TRAP transporter large permease [Paracoccus sp. J55]